LQKFTPIYISIGLSFVHDAGGGTISIAYLGAAVRIFPNLQGCPEKDNRRLLHWLPNDSFPFGEVCFANIAQVDFFGCMTIEVRSTS
jgi:hypothetical protein